MSKKFTATVFLILSLAIISWLESAAVAVEPEKAKTNVQSIVPDWVVYPEEEWVKITPAQAGFDVVKFNQIIANSPPKPGAFGGFIPDSKKWGAVLTRGGYLVQAWGDSEYKHQSASLGKNFTLVLVGLAVDEGLIKLDDLISETWTGEGQLSHPHKYLTRGHHKTLTWRHLINHQGGFVLESGYHWRTKNWWFHTGIPEWANWTGDPFYDNYSHTEPGTVNLYSSGGFCRLGQALTALWNRDLKEVLDEKVFSYMGIPADRWDWLPGGVVHFTKDFYPALPGYGDYVDPPYYINGHIVRGGAGWIIMNPKDLARFGLLIATRGIWKGKQLVSPKFLPNLRLGVGIHVTAGDVDTYIAIGRVNTEGCPSLENFKELIIGPVVVSPE